LRREIDPRSAHKGIIMTFRVLAATGLVFSASVAIAQPVKQKPATELLIMNASAAPVTEVSVEAEGDTVRLSKALPPNSKATLKLPKMTSCTVAVMATFADRSIAGDSAFDVCKEHTIRFTN
jgi:hypothetical protein